MSSVPVITPPSTSQYQNNNWLLMQFQKCLNRIDNLKLDLKCYALIKIIRNKSHEDTEVVIARVNAFLERNRAVEGLILNRRCNGGGRTPLIVAVIRGNLAVVKLLIERGANLSVGDRCGKTALSYAILTKKQEEITQLLIESMKNAEHFANDGLLYTSIYASNFFAAKLLIKHGISVNREEGEKRVGPLNLAVIEDNLEIVKLLIESGASVNEKDVNGVTPLMRVRWARNSATTIAKLLIQHGANVNAQDQDGRTPLMWTYNEDVTKELIEAGADIFLANKTGKSGLQHMRALFKYKSSLLPFVIKTYLEQLFLYFHDTKPCKIRYQVQTYIESLATTSYKIKKEATTSKENDKDDNSTNNNNNNNNNNEDDSLYFPVNKNHFYALQEIESEKPDILCSEKYTNDFYFLPYFISSDFQIKILNDVINRLAEDNVELDGQLLIGRLKRTRNPRDLEKLNTILDELKEKWSLAFEFYELTVKMTPEILKFSNRIFSTTFENSTTSEFENKLNEHLSKHMMQSKNSQIIINDNN